MKIPLFAVRQTLEENLEKTVIGVLRSRQYLMGPALSKFESELRDYQNISHALGVANGTDALALCMLALGVSHGDRIMTVPNAGGYASFAANMIGAVPVLVDVDPASAQMDPVSLRAALRAVKPKAIVVTHLYGLAAPIADILTIADNEGIPVIEDVAQAMGTTIGDGKKAGAAGAIASFSFYPTKNLGAAGDAGAVTTNDGRLAERIRSLRQYGWEEKYRATLFAGRNSRMDELQAAILSARLPGLDAWNRERRAIWVQYREAAGKHLNMVGRNDESFTAHLCVALSRDRAAWQDKLQKLEISTAIHYPVMDHEQPAMRGIVETPVPLNGAQELTKAIFTLPCFPGMTDDEIEYVCAALKGGIG